MVQCWSIFLLGFTFETWLFFNPLISNDLPEGLSLQTHAVQPFAELYVKFLEKIPEFAKGPNMSGWM